MRKRAFLAATAASAGMLMQARAAAANQGYIPAPPQYRIVYDGGVGYSPGSTDAQAVGQYADTNTNTVHTTRGYNRRALAQDVGQLFGYNVLDDGQRAFFSRLLGTDPARWTNPHGAQPEGQGSATGDEAFADYYAVAATGGLKPIQRRRDGTITGQSLVWGDVPIDRRKLKLFTAALRRLGERQQLPAYRPR